MILPDIERPSLLAAAQHYEKAMVRRVDTYFDLVLAFRLEAVPGQVRTASQGSTS